MRLLVKMLSSSGYNKKKIQHFCLFFFFFFCLVLFEHDLKIANNLNKYNAWHIISEISPSQT